MFCREDGDEIQHSEVLQDLVPIVHKGKVQGAKLGKRMATMKLKGMGVDVVSVTGQATCAIHAHTFVL